MGLGSSWQQEQPNPDPEGEEESEVKAGDRLVALCDVEETALGLASNDSILENHSTGLSYSIFNPSAKKE